MIEPQSSSFFFFDKLLCIYFRNEAFKCILFTRVFQIGFILVLLGVFSRIIQDGWNLGRNLFRVRWIETRYRKLYYNENKMCNNNKKNRYIILLWIILYTQTRVMTNQSKRIKKKKKSKMFEIPFFNFRQNRKYWKTKEYKC